MVGRTRTLVSRPTIEREWAMLSHVDKRRLEYALANFLVESGMFRRDNHGMPRWQAMDFVGRMIDEMLSAGFEIVLKSEPIRLEAPTAYGRFVGEPSDPDAGGMTESERPDGWDNPSAWNYHG